MPGKYEERLNQVRAAVTIAALAVLLVILGLRYLFGSHLF
jgi:hypothetical protein